MDRLARVAVTLGLVAWVARQFQVGLQPLHTDWAITLLLLSPLVIAPVLLAGIERERSAERTGTPPELALLKLVRRLQLPSALCLCVAVAIPLSSTSAAWTLPWAATSLLLAVVALIRLRRTDLRTSPELASCAGQLFLPIGACWLTLWRHGTRPLGFQEVIVMLTAIHFHYAGFVLPWLTSWSARLVPGRWGQLTCWGVIVGVPAVALGITTSQLRGDPVVEAVAAGGLSLVGISVALLQWAAAVRSDFSRVSRGLLELSSGALIGTMLLSLLYGLRFWHQWNWLDIPWMRAWHGSGNALGACLLGVIGWSLALSRRDHPQAT